MPALTPPQAAAASASRMAQGSTDMDSLSNFADSMAVAGPVVLGFILVVAGAVWAFKAARRRRGSRPQR